jgi:hypothetical protein
MAEGWLGQKLKTLSENQTYKAKGLCKEVWVLSSNPSTLKKKQKKNRLL